MDQHRQLPKERSSYRPDLDGLRAIAVLLVIAFHARLGGFEGGFVGVDVFFVLTGFLITGLFVAEHRRNGRISITDFYARRIRRLLPLAALVIVSTMIAGILLLPPLATTDLLGDARASVLYFVNWEFASQATAYSDVEVTDSLYLHFWSLAVEEQFYIVWPLILVAVGWLLYRRSSNRFVPVLGAVLGVICTLSLAASIILTERLGPEAYYMTFTRIWEIGLGAGLALVIPLIRRVPRMAAEVAAAIGLVAIVASALLFGELTPFPGSAALLPTLGAAMIVAAGMKSATVANRALSLRPLPYVGRLSYALYLWHWPAIGVALLLNERAGNGWPTGVAIALAVVATFLLSAASHAWVENPLRYSPWIRDSKRRNYAMGAVAMGLPLILIASYLSFGNTGDKNYLAEASTDTSGPGVELILSPSEAEEDTPSKIPGSDECHIGQSERSPNFDCVFGDPQGVQTIILLGDSHARHWLPALDLAGQKRGWQVLALTKSGCTPIDVRIWNSNLDREYSECEQWRHRVAEHLSNSDKAELLIISRSHGYGSVITDDGVEVDIDDAPDEWRRGAERTFAKFGSAADEILVFRDTPWAPEDVPACISAAASVSDCNLNLNEHGDLDAVHHRMERAAAGPLVAFADPTSLVCPKTICPMVTEDGLIKYSDSHHLTHTFSKRLHSRLGSIITSVISR